MGQYLPHTFRPHKAVRVADNRVQRIALGVVFTSLMFGCILIAWLDGSGPL